MTNTSAVKRVKPAVRSKLGKAMSKVKNRSQLRTKRATRVRKTLRGDAAKPRLSVLKTNRHVCAQIIDDESGRTLVSASTFCKEMQGTEHNRRNKAAAREVGKLLAERAQEANVQQVVFDRGPAKYHGVLAELADGAREAGLKI